MAIVIQIKKTRMFIQPSSLSSPLQLKQVTEVLKNTRSSQLDYKKEKEKQ